MVRAKFKVQSVEKRDDAGVPEGGVAKVTLTPVTSGSEENDKFYNLTPAGQITLETINGEAAKQFEEGKEVYVDFTPVE